MPNERVAKEFFFFNGGLNLKFSGDNIQPTQLQEAVNVSLAEEVGTVKTRRGRTAWSATVFSGNVDVHYQNLFATPGLFVRNGTVLYNGTEKIKQDLSDERMRFEEFAGWLVMVNGIENLKYKPTGMGLHWMISCSAYWEVALSSGLSGAAINNFRLATLYTTTQRWEVEQVAGSTPTTLGVTFYTSTFETEGTVSTEEGTTDETASGSSSSSGDQSSYSHTFAADNVVSWTSCWIADDAGTTSPWWRWDLGSGVTKTVSRITITMPDSSHNLNRAPEDFTIAGSNNGTDWTTLLTVTGESAWSYNEERTYNLSATGAYRYYRFMSTLTIGPYASGGQGVIISEIELLTVTVASASSEAIPGIDICVPVQLGITPPSSVPTLAEGGAGSPNGAYTYKVTYLNTGGFESNPSSASAQISVTSKKILLTSIPVSTDPQVVQRRIYRIATAGSTWKLVATIDNSWETTYTDDTADASLGAEAPSNNDVPPAFSEIHSHNSLLWGVKASTKNVIHYCNAFDEWEYWNDTGYEPFGSASDETQVLESLAEFLIPVQEIQIWNFNTRESPEEKNRSLSQRGVFDRKACVNGGELIFFAENTGIFYFDAVRDRKLSLPVDAVFDIGGSYSYRVNENYADNMRLAFLDDQLILSYTATGNTTNSRTLLYDHDLKIFESFFDTGYQDFTVDKHNKDIYGVGSDGVIYKVNNGTTDNGTVISWSFRTKDFCTEFGGSTLLKRGDHMKLDCNPNGSDLTVEVYLDGTVRQTRVLTGSARSVHRWRLPVDRDFYRLSVRCSGSGVQYVYGFGFEVEVQTT